MPESINIAICGAGITGICLAHGLLKHPHLDVICYEASTTIRDEGAAIGLGGNAQEALSLIRPELREALDKAGGTAMIPAVRVMIVSCDSKLLNKGLTTQATGKDSGKHVGDVNPKVPKITVHRGRFLRQLQQAIPDGIVNTGKKLQSIHETPDGVILIFENGSSERVDGVIACDGINSVARETVLGSDHPAVKPVYTGGYNHRVVVPLDTAKEAFGEEYCSLLTQHGWVGDGGFLLTDLVDNATAMQVIAGWSTKDIWPHESPFVPWPKDQVRKDLQDWGEMGKAMTKIFTEEPTLFAAGGRVHLFTPSYCKGNVCIVGDAAQSFSPFQGAGAGQAIEDALLLETVLGSITSPKDIARAFLVYEKIRLPRRSGIADSSRWAALLFTGRSDTGLDMEGLRRQLDGFDSKIVNYDLRATREEALQLMRRN